MTEFAGFADSAFPSPDDAPFDWFKKPEQLPYIPAYAFLPGIEPPAITSATVSQLPELGGLQIHESFSGNLCELDHGRTPETAIDAAPQSTKPKHLLEERVGYAGLNIIVQHGDPEGLGILEQPYFPGLDYWRAIS